MRKFKAKPVADLLWVLVGARRAVVLLQILVIAGCGASATGADNPPDVGPDNGLGLAAGKGGGDADAPNVVRIDVFRLNLPLISITVCKPGSTDNCQTISRIAVHTGFSGLRIASNAISPQLLEALPQQMHGSSNAPLAECVNIVTDRYSWGGIRTADVMISGEEASSIPIQVIADPLTPSVPAACSATAIPMMNSRTLGVNGIIGIGPASQDCGATCAQTSSSGKYYLCAPGTDTCTPSVAALAEQVANPVANFATDNNGSIIELPSLSADGTGSDEGHLVFGIGTRSNNALGTATVHTTDPSGALTILYNGLSYASTIDSGLPFNAFSDSSLPQCPDASGLYCPASTLQLTAVVVGNNGSASTVDFSVANWQQLLAYAPWATSFDDIAGVANLGDFVLGLPFFFGRNVFIAIDGQNTAGGPGPYFAY